MLYLIIFCTIIGITSKTYSLETTNFGTVPNETPEGKERANITYNFGTMVYSKGLNIGEISECLKLFGYTSN